jgi:hypothetical protein
MCSNSSSTGVQTETHLYDKLIDSNHYWNEWDLRKQTIKMVNIRGYQTVSVQTVTSIFKVDNGTQIYEKVEQDTMTGVEAGTNPVWPKNYIVGLRN